MTTEQSTTESEYLDPTEVICVCRGITRGQVQAALQDPQQASLTGLAQTLGAGAECGSCTPALRELLGDSPWIETAPVQTVLSGDANDPRRVVQLDFELPPGVAYPASYAGQHITVQGLIQGRWVSRTYTLINPGQTQRVVSIAVRRLPDGEFTPWLLDASERPKRIRISEPLGQDHWQGRPRHTVCFVGGIGVTLAKSLLEQLPEQVRFHLDYSARTRADLVFAPALEHMASTRQHLTLQCRTDDVNGYISQADVVATQQRFPGSQYVLCGPAPFVSQIEQWLLQAKVPARHIQIEKFFIVQAQAQPRRNFKTWGYTLGALLAVLPLLWLLPGLQDNVPHFAHNVGHEKLVCADCHAPAPGTLRQQLQAKFSYVIGRRETNAAFMFSPVDSRACLDCHQRSQDRHPPHRFLEPRFEQVRAALAPQRCASCHREHEARRVTVGDSGFCVNCHKELEVKKERIQPSHSELIKGNRWETCLGCHDFHNNHAWKEPESLDQAVPAAQIKDYFDQGKSPYGDPKEKAKTKTKAAPASSPKAPGVTA